MFDSITRPSKEAQRFLGYLRGHGAEYGTVGLDWHDEAPLRTAEPPIELRRELPYVGVMYRIERSLNGNTFAVICFACDLVWLWGWRPAVMDGFHVILPKLGGGSPLNERAFKDRRLVACSCVWGQTTDKNRRKASTAEIAEAVTWGALRATEGRELMRQIPGALGDAIEKLTGGRPRPAQEATPDEIPARQDDDLPF